MPIHMPTHEPEIELSAGSLKSDLVEFLYNNPDYGYQPEELERHFTTTEETIADTLSELHAMGYIGITIDGYYHSLPGRKRLTELRSARKPASSMFTQPTIEHDS